MRATTNPQSLASPAASRSASERTSVSPLELLAGTAGAGLLFGLLDLALGLTASAGGLSGALAALPTLSIASALGFLVPGLAAGLAALLRRDARHVLLAALLGLVAFELDLLLARGSLDPSSSSSFAPSAAVGLAAALLGYFALGARARAARNEGDREPPGRSATGAARPATSVSGSLVGALSGGVLALAFACLALLLLRSSGLPRGLFAAGTLVALAAGLLLGGKRLSPSSGKGFVALALAFLAALATAFLLPRAEAGSSSRATTTGHRVPRVLLIVVDTLRADALSCASPSGPPTPNLDRLAARATRFSAARAAAPWTLPSVATILTGVSPLVHRATRRDSVLPEGIPTLAERLAAEGYRTAAIGHNYVLSPTRRLDRGFDEYLFSARGTPPARSLGFLLFEAWRSDPSEQEPVARKISERALDWIDEHASEDFFLWLHYYDPHLAYEPPAGFGPRGPPPSGMKWSLSFAAFEKIRGGYLVPDEAGRRWIRALYDGEVRLLDQELGALFDELESKGLLEDTLVLLTSDHGEEFFEHDGFEHGHTVFEEVLRVPLIVKLPGQREGAIVEGPVTLEGLAPSLLALCGVASEPGAFSAPPWFGPDGKPAPAAEQGALFGTGTLYYQDRAALLFGGWKYAKDLVSGKEELYDLARDPGETRSLARDEPERLAQARARCEAVFQAAQALRERYAVGEGARTELGAGELGALEDIGYVNGAVSPDPGEQHP